MNRAAARDESGGSIEAVSDAEIMDAYRDLARHEGIFVEPASAASVAGLRKRVQSAGLRDASSVVCVLTGNGLKDPDTARSLTRDVALVDATADAVMGAIAHASRA